MKMEHLAHFYIAGFTYYDGAKIFQKLKIGQKLKLKLEDNNRYDARAVAIYYKKHKIGFVPRTENRIFYKLLKVGLKNNLRILVQSRNQSANPEQQIQVITHLIK